ncbi:peroxisome biogenesis factor [Cyclospora cayetanensis]|uniref:Peroxin-7 n=1 Tax=Cyclospora cayetanensis TaxID=88456 RepID=A0A1D3CUD2_9EIME|nr:peroxisome biogenesis factor [Cyclospora cayetanensis]
MSTNTAISPVHMGRLRLCGQACRFSPFSEDLLAVASSQLFGMAGPGSLEIFSLDPAIHITSRAPTADTVTLPLGSHADVQARPGEVVQPKRVAVLHHQESVNDVAWSERCAQTLVGGGGGGRITIWRLSDQKAAFSGIQNTGNEFGGFSVGELKGHTRDVTSLSWSCVEKRILASTAIDGHLRVWDMQKCSLLRVLQHSHAPATCSCVTSPVDAGLIASVGANGRLSVHDLRNPSPGTTRNMAAWSVVAHPCEVLSVDWVKHRPWQLLTGAADGTIALWDLRKSSSVPRGDFSDANVATGCRLSSTQAHQLAVRRVVSHPFNAQRFASCSYDMQVKIWDCDEGTSLSMVTRSEGQPECPSGVPSPFVGGSGWVRLCACYDHHREFILGLDWSTFKCGVIASTSWDRSLCVWNADTGPAPPQVPKRPLFLSMKVSK